MTAGAQWLWSAADAATATGGDINGAWSGINGVSIDTRELVAGDLFVALTGDNRDGHAFVRQALDAGAGAALVSRMPDDVAPDAPLLLVPDTLKALEDLGRAARARMPGQVIAVTGSVGKTSTKEMMRTMLAAQGKVHAAVRSFNNHWGVPLTLARMPADTDYAVIEIGMNHPGEITPLSQMARPHVALITTVAAVHMAAFESVAQIADAKAEIFAGLEPGGTAILNADIDTFEQLKTAAAAHRIQTFGTSGTDMRLGEVRVAGETTVVRAESADGPITFRIGAPGAHFAANALGALLAVAAAGADLARAALALAHWSAPGGRGSRLIIDLDPSQERFVTLLDESYNANPASVGAALAVLAETSVEHRGRRVAFLGDMLELGPDELAFHADLAELPSIGALTHVHTCGPRMQALHDALPPSVRGTHFADSSEMAAGTARLLQPGDVCMVKGSLGARMAPVVETIKALGTVRAAPQATEGA